MIARFYGIDPFRLTADQQIGLYANIGPIRAGELLERSGEFSPEAIRDLTREATGDNDAANHAMYLALKRDTEREARREVAS